jgi:hypothetical protein
MSTRGQPRWARRIVTGLARLCRSDPAVPAALRPGGVLMLGRCEWLLTPGQFGVAAAGPELYRKDAA